MLIFLARCSTVQFLSVNIYIYKFQASNTWCKEECPHHPQVKLSDTNKLSHTGLIHMHPKKPKIVILTDIQTFQVSLTCTCKECHLQVDFVHNACRKVSEWRIKKKRKYFIITKCVTCMQVKWNRYWPIFTHFRPALHARNAPSR